MNEEIKELLTEQAQALLNEYKFSSEFKPEFSGREAEKLSNGTYRTYITMTDDNYDYGKRSYCVSPFTFEVLTDKYGVPERAICYDTEGKEFGWFENDMDITTYQAKLSLKTETAIGDIIELDNTGFTLKSKALGEVSIPLEDADGQFSIGDKIKVVAVNGEISQINKIERDLSR